MEKLEDLKSKYEPRIYIVCPLCLMNRVFFKHRKGVIKFDRWNPDTEFIQVRYGGGKISGFWKDPAQSLTIREDLVAGYRDMLLEIKRACERILAHLKELGL